MLKMARGYTYTDRHRHSHACARRQRTHMMVCPTRESWTCRQISVSSLG